MYLILKSLTRDVVKHNFCWLENLTYVDIHIEVINNYIIIPLITNQIKRCNQTYTFWI